jgi:hypothetical protein
MRADGRRALARDAALALAAGIGLTLVVRQIAGALIDHFHAQAVLSIQAPTIIATAVPALGAVSGILKTLLVTAGFLATVTMLLRGARSRWMAIALAALLPLVAFPGAVRTPGEFALRYGIELLSLAAALAFCGWFGRRNYLAYAVVLWIMAFESELAELYGNASPVQFWTLLTIAAAGLLWALLPLRKVARA